MKREFEVALKRASRVCVYLSTGHLLKNIRKEVCQGKTASREVIDINGPVEWLTHQPHF
ncbi:MAG: hypothetical protein JRJ77_12420 [Deltaproteobacteria bacterium]|nr:hypothetical protein [Deltaproteobacteria bacterium]